MASSRLAQPQHGHAELAVQGGVAQQGRLQVAPDAARGLRHVDVVVSGHVPDREIVRCRRPQPQRLPARPDLSPGQLHPVHLPGHRGEDLVHEVHPVLLGVHRDVEVALGVRGARQAVVPARAHGVVTRDDEPHGGPAGPDVVAEILLADEVCVLLRAQPDPARRHGAAQLASPHSLAPLRRPRRALC